MFQAIVCGVAVGLSSLTAAHKPAAVPVAAMDAKHPVIVHIVSREQTLTVKAGDKGLLYSLTGTNGKIMIANASPAEFEKLQPAMYRQVRQYMAAKNNIDPAFDDAVRAATDAMPIMADNRAE